MCRLPFLCEKLHELVHLYGWYYRSRVSYAYDTELIFIASETDSLKFMLQQGNNIIRFMQHNQIYVATLQRGTTSLKIDKKTGNKTITEEGLTFILLFTARTEKSNKPSN